MAQPQPAPRRFDMAAAMAQLREEREKLESMQARMAEDTTTVHAKDRVLTVTLDGRGELTKLVFNGNAYRRLAPAELAGIIVETIVSGRRQAIEKLGGLMGSDPLPGIGFADLATGSRPLTDVLDAFLGQALEQLPERVRNRVNQQLEGGL